MRGKEGASPPARLRSSSTRRLSIGANVTWTEEDDKKLIDLLNEHLEGGGLTKQSYVEIGTKLQRTPNAVAQRWSNARTGNSRAGRISEALSSFADDVLFRQLAMQSRPLDGQRMTRKAAKAAMKVAEVHAFKEAAPFDPTSDSGNANEKVWHPLDQKVKDAFFITVEHLEQASARKRRNTNGLVFRLKGLHNTYERDLLHELGEIFGFGVTMERRRSSCTSHRPAMTQVGVVVYPGTMILSLSFPRLQRGRASSFVRRTASRPS